MTSQQPFLVPSIIFAVLAIPLALGVVPLNRVYGIRTRKTLSDPALWQRANIVGGWAFLGAALCHIVVGRYVPMPPPVSSDLAAYGRHLLVFLGPLLVAGLITRAYIRRL
jgi:uncharacterized membrane protein